MFAAELRYDAPGGNGLMTTNDIRIVLLFNAHRLPSLRMSSASQLPYTSHKF